MPSSERSVRIKACFEKALSLSPKQRKAYILTLPLNERFEVQQLLEDSACGQAYFDSLSQSLFGPAIEPKSSEDPFDLCGKTLGSYRVTQLLANGGMGVVYRGVDTVLQRSVALKLLTPDEWSNPVDRQQLLVEARAVSRFTHPNIGITYGMTSTELEQDVIVMAYYGGQTLQQKLDAGSVDPLLIQTWMEQLLSGLDHAHQEGIIHRDIKPSNIMVLEDNTIRILDFGIAISCGAERQSIGSGTTTFMSPEQIRNQPLTNATDLWSAGVVLLELAISVGWLNKVNAFVWAQNSAVSENRGPDWLIGMLSRLLILDATERLEAPKELSTEISQPRSHLPETATRSRLGLIAAAACLCLIATGVGWKNTLLSTPPIYKRVVLHSDSNIGPVHSRLQYDLNQWLKMIETEVPNLSYMGIDRPTRPVEGENLRVALDINEQEEFIVAALTVVDAEGSEVANWSVEYPPEQSNLMAQDLRSELSVFLEIPAIQVQNLSNFAAFNSAEAFQLCADASSVLAKVDENMLINLRELERAEANLLRANKIEPHAAIDAALATAYRLRYESDAKPLHIQKAIFFITQSLAKNSRLLSAHVEMGRINLARGEYGNALAAYTVALNIYPNHTDLHYGLAKTHLALGDPDAASLALAKYQRVAPFDWRVYNLKGLTAVSDNRYADAIREFKNALEIRPGERELTIALAQAKVDLARRGNSPTTL